MRSSRPSIKGSGSCSRRPLCSPFISSFSGIVLKRLQELDQIPLLRSAQDFFSVFYEDPDVMTAVREARLSGRVEVFRTRRPFLRRAISGRITDAIGVEVLLAIVRLARIIGRRSGFARSQDRAEIRSRVI